MIRRATSADADAIAQIWGQRETLGPDKKEHIAEIRGMVGRIAEPFGFWVSEGEGRVQGWVLLFPFRASPAVRSSMAEVSIFVDERRRGLGVGSELVSHAIERAKAAKIEYVLAWVGASNQRVRRLITSLGASISAEFPSRPINPRRDKVLLYRWAL
ncbi:N-acetyltransferase family protein [Hyphococcus sp.]|jgi:L-amino acid N-acyltransferase YncA|uniref:GNAT family N-acetyltransferase n=1 Tax=Hyphococcus sp. TaxID=2038636 RepID=UPI003D11209C